MILKFSFPVWLWNMDISVFEAINQFSVLSQFVSMKVFAVFHFIDYTPVSSTFHQSIIMREYQALILNNR